MTNQEACEAKRAVQTVAAGETLRKEAAALTDDLNAAYFLVHQAVSRALAQPGRGAAVALPRKSSSGEEACGAPGPA